jgi:ribosomal protein S18 acetylase RimI-like enzyme
VVLTFMVFMLPHLQIRSVTETDLVALDELVRDVFDTPKCRAFFLSRCGHVVPQVCLAGALVAVQHDVIAGFILWQQDEFLGVITGIGVRTTHRRFGVASFLLEAAVEKLRTEGLRVLDVVCDTHFSGCMALFVKHKFQILQSDESYILFSRRLVGRRNRGDGFDV